MSQVTEYSEKVMDHFMNPRNMGEIEDPSGVGTVGNAKCGDIMRMYLDIDENQIVREAKFKTFGCGAAVATSSMATELVKGKSVREALEVTNKAVMEALDGLPPVKIHCSLLAEQAIHAALWDYATKNNISSVAAVADEMASSDCFVCEADLFLPRPDVLCRELAHSGYFGRMVAGRSDDWVFDTDAAGRITRVGKGGTDCFNMVGVSYFRQADAAKVARAVAEDAKRPENANLFWDEVVDRLVKSGELDLVVHPVADGEIVECDTVDDLRRLEGRLR